jgi:hypothetical protein
VAASEQDCEVWIEGIQFLVASAAAKGAVVHDDEPEPEVHGADAEGDADVRDWLEQNNLSSIDTMLFGMFGDDVGLQRVLSMDPKEVKSLVALGASAAEAAELRELIGLAPEQDKDKRANRPPDRAAFELSVSSPTGLYYVEGVLFHKQIEDRALQAAVAGALNSAALLPAAYGDIQAAEVTVEALDLAERPRAVTKDEADIAIYLLRNMDRVARLKQDLNLPGPSDVSIEPDVAAVLERLVAELEAAPVTAAEPEPEPEPEGPAKPMGPWTSEKDAKLAQKLGQLQPFTAVFP